MKRKTKFIYNGVLLTAVGLAMRGTQLLFGAYVARAVGAEGVGINTHRKAAVCRALQAPPL